jgi:tRNA pseudouridine38-40 synthase
VAAFTTSAAVPRGRMALAINARLPDDVQIVRAARVSETFNPISDAIEKSYRYRIAHGTPQRPLFDRFFNTFVHDALDVRRMQEAAVHFQGTHDFASLTRMQHGRESTVRTITACSVTASTKRRLRIDVTGDGFLWNMVRILVGTLVAVGRGKLQPQAIPGILAACDRTAAGVTMPPQGLCLMWIRYKDGS